MYCFRFKPWTYRATVAAAALKFWRLGWRLGMGLGLILKRHNVFQYKRQRYRCRSVCSYPYTFERDCFNFFEIAWLGNVSNEKRNNNKKTISILIIFELT